MISLTEWEGHNKWEREWWGTCVNTFDEQLKQDRLAQLMRFYDDFPDYRKHWDLNGLSILDIGGGPISLLLRCVKLKQGVIVDPCEYPDWVMMRYELAGIQYIKARAETLELDAQFDEVWIYNVLQHVQSPEKVVAFARRHSNKLRVCENINWGKAPGHPHDFTSEMLDELYGQQGTVTRLNDIDLVPRWLWHGVFEYV